MVIPVSNTCHLACGNQHHWATRGLEQLAKLTGEYEIRAGKHRRYTQYKYKKVRGG